MHNPMDRLAMTSLAPKASVTWRELLTAWIKVINGKVPLLSIEITKECPLRCPGCYAYGDTHLGGNMTLRDLGDQRGDALVNGVLGIVRKHRPMHVSFVGGEPLIRHRELNRILPVISDMGVFSLVVTSAAVPIPAEWMKIPKVRVAVSVDGLPEDHDVRRKPATYERVLRNIRGREVNIHWVITRPMLRRPGYLKDYLAFWSVLGEVHRIWVSLYTPQIGDQSSEKLLPEDRELLARQLPALAAHYPKLLMNAGIASALLNTPRNPDECLFAKMSTNFSADLRSRVEPCVFGGTPDCSQCGCAISSGLNWIRTLQIARGLKIDPVIVGSIKVGLAMNRLRSRSTAVSRWSENGQKPHGKPELVQIHF